ncbi:hypothetical protein DV702_16510 [Sporosarcina sp. PTS2304]|uniref:FIVAR domain-containing protein n=1 Tax=Sporosarcina sp. PTS2304 TaxID=2283194 RepID=UPI000E0D3553|nr:FIVAR domain-containing protein [Sporosarcina sp. PTS2304]AXI01182.1 hypothetical protein DV702_16510 [Sporosarcina sp. PTS2304]
MTKKPFNTLSKAALAAALATTALIPVASADAATAYSIDEVVIAQGGQQLAISSSDYREAVIEGSVNPATVGHVKSSNGKYYSSTDFREAVIETGSETAALESLNGSSKDKAITTVPGKFVDGKLVPVTDEVKSFASVASINATTIEVTFDQKVASLPDASAFSIPGIAVTKTAFKEDTGQKVVVLTTSTQSSQAYTLTYNGNSKTFIGKTNLGSVLLSAEKYEVEIVPSENKLTPVEITAELENFPEGAEAVIEFTTSFGKVVDVTTTQNGKAVFQLTPLETLKDQTASVTGKVVEVKNPTTGQTYPEFKNSSVGTVNVKFVINEKTGEDVIKSYRVDTAYAEQADRVYVKMNGGIDGKIKSALAYQPEKLIAGTNSDTEKELYRHLKDAMFSKIEAAVVNPAGAVTKANVDAVKASLKNVFTHSNGKDYTAKDLRNELRNDAFNNRLTNVYLPLYYGKTAVTSKERAQALVHLDKEINNISDATLNGILEYYKLVSKFVIQDNVKDSAAPQNADNIYPAEFVYEEDNALVLVLPGQRATDSIDYVTQDFKQNNQKNAKFLKDNASHQVLFVNDAQKDRYEITGDPTFKLEDAESLKLISVTSGRYLVQQVQEAAVGKFCQIPYAVESEEGDGYGPGNNTSTGPSFTGTTIGAGSYEISEDYKRFDAPKGTVNGDKLGEIKVVFSEAVSVQDEANVLDAKNWTIDGIKLGALAADYGISARLVSTDPTKQLRDAVILTITSKEDGTQRDNKYVEKFIENANGTHKVEISNVGDWAAQTDSKNIVPTQSLDYEGKAKADATPWTREGQVSGKTSGAIAPGEAFVVRSKGEKANATNGNDKDLVRVLFSEPMKITGTDSILEKANYRLDGKELPSVGSSIKLGIEGVDQFNESTCAVTIELPKGYLQDKNDANVLSISNVKGLDDATKLTERIQLAYARQYTIVGNKININNTLVPNGLYTNQINVISYDAGTKAEARVYKDANGNVIELTGSPWVENNVDFFTKHPTTTPSIPATPAERAALQAAVTAAETAAGNADAADYEAGALTTYETAIANAKAVLNNPNSTVAQVNAAETVLNNATQAFNDAKKPGTTPPATPAERAALQTAVTDATTVANAADAADYEAGALATYQAAIADALAVLDDAEATKAEVDAALATLNTATQAFNDAKIPADNELVFGATDLGQRYKAENITQTIIVSFDESKLPANLQGKTYQLELEDGTTYNFRKSAAPTKPNDRNTNVPATYTQQQIEAGKLIAN